jgi:signal transduction histidine kinase
MSLRHAYTLVTLVSIAATAGTVAGFGPFQNHSLANPLQLVGVLVVLLAMNVLTIVALVSERSEAQNANKVKAMFLANTSHELRTPLNAIIGFSSLIARQAANANDARYADYANTILTSGEHLLALINNLLDMSRIEAGRFELHEEDFPFSDAISDVVDLVRLQIAEKSIVLAVDCAAPAPVIRADAMAMRQILLNLVSNAIKFTNDGGSIRIAAEPSIGGGLNIRVMDSGIGIAPEAVGRIFRPFERAQAETVRKTEGTGLGLSITRGLVLLHGGTINVESRLGAGTIVSVSLPANRVVSSHPANRDISNGGPRVLNSLSR